MNLVDDYLRAVAILLPKDQREDIVAELRDIVLSKIEEKEAALGRPLTPDETEALLREVGHPLVVAARYREGPQSIVSPALYPFWVFAVKAALAVQLCILGIVFLVRSVGGGDVGRALGHAISNGITGAATLIGFITVAAWIIERQAVKPDFVYQWKVKDLKMLEIAAWDVGEWRTHLGSVGPDRWYAGEAGASTRAQRRWRRRQRSEAGRGLGIIVGSAVFLLWWTGLLHFGFAATPEALRSVGIEPGSLGSIDWSALKADISWPVIAYFLTCICWGFSLLARPFATRVHGLFDVVLGVALLGFSAWVAWVSPLSAALGGDTLASAALRVWRAVEGGPPFPLSAAVLVGLAAMVLTGLSRVVRGVWLVVEPRASGVAP